jgi:hypothetical protein
MDKRSEEKGHKKRKWQWKGKNDKKLGKDKI